MAWATAESELKQKRSCLRFKVKGLRCDRALLQLLLLVLLLLQLLLKGVRYHGYRQTLLWLLLCAFLVVAPLPHTYHMHVLTALACLMWFWMSEKLDSCRVAVWGRMTEQRICLDQHEIWYVSWMLESLRSSMKGDQPEGGDPPGQTEKEASARRVASTKHCAEIQNKLQLFVQ